MKRLLLAIFALVAFASPAAAQSPCTALQFGAVLTPAQWQFCFQAKQDALTFTPINPANLVGAPPITIVTASGVTTFGLALSSNFVVNGSNQLALANAVSITTSLTVPTIYGGTAAGSILNIAGTSNGSPSGDAIQISASNVYILPRSFGGGTAILNVGLANSSGGEIVIASPTANAMTIVPVSSASGTGSIPSGTFTFSGRELNETLSGLKIFTGGATGTPTTGQASFGGASSSGAVLIGNGTTNDFSLQNSANLTVCSVTHAVQALNCNQLTLTVALPIAQGGTGQTSASAAIAALMPTPTRAGDVAYWNGSIWTTLAGNNSGTQILTENSSGVPSWAATGSVSSVTIGGAGGNIPSGTCTITTSGTCIIGAPGGFLNVLRNNSLTAWFHGCTASACTISPQFSVTAAVSNGGACEITISSTTTFTTGEYVPVQGIVGATGCNGTFVVTVTNGTQLTLQGTTFGGTYTSGGTAGGGFCAEGLFVIPTGAAVTCQLANTSVNSKPYYLMKITGNTSVTDVIVRFVVESVDIAYLSAQNATFQAGVVNNTGGTITPALQTKYAGSQDSWGSPTIDLAATSLQSCTNTSACVEAYTLTVSNNANNGYELNLDLGNNFSSNAKNASIYFFDFRKDVNASTGLNSSPPPPEFRDPSSDIHWCERFFQTAFDNGVAPGSATTVGAWITIPTAANTNTAGAGAQFRTPMRADPLSIISYDGAGTAGKSSYMSSTGTFTNAQGGPNIISGTIGQRGFAIFPPNATNPLMFLWTADATIIGG